MWVKAETTLLYFNGTKHPIIKKTLKKWIFMKKVSFMDKFTLTFKIYKYALESKG